MFDFPTTPADGSEFTPPGGPTYVYQTPVWMLKADADLIFGIGLTQTGDTVNLDPATDAIIGGVLEVPNDGNIYGRIDDLWVPILSTITYRQRNASTTYVPGATVKAVYVEAYGAGGAGGGAGATDGTQVSAGSGGGSGGKVLGVLYPPFEPGGYVITIGAVGVGIVGAQGGNGGVTSFSTYFSLYGGVGGAVDKQSAGINMGIPAQGGRGSFVTGIPGWKIITLAGGGNGQPSLVNPALNRALGGNGGDSSIGGGAMGVSVNQAVGLGSPAAASGGGGVGTAKSGVAKAGGDGGKSVIILREFS